MKIKGRWKKITYVPRHDAATTQAENVGGVCVADRTATGLSRLTEKSFQSLVRHREFYTVWMEPASAPKHWRTVHVLIRLLQDCGSVDTCSGTSEKQYRAIASHFELVSGRLDADICTGIPVSRTVPLATRMVCQALTRLSVLYDCTSENIIWRTPPD